MQDVYSFVTMQFKDILFGRLHVSLCGVMFKGTSIGDPIKGTTLAQFGALP